MNVIIAARERISSTFAESVYDNPVVAREFRTRMRGWKAFGIMGGYVLLLGIVLFITMWSLWKTYSYSGPAQYAMSLINQNIGQKLFVSLTIVQSIMLTLLLPSLGSSSVTSELEKKTIEMLALSKLTAGKIVIGKHLSVFLFAVMLLVSSLPLAGLCIMFGGISPAEVAVSYALLLSWSFMFTAIGVFWSSLCNKTAAASLWSYGTCVGYMLFTLTALGMAVGSGYSGRDSFVLGAINPTAGPYVAMLKAEICGISIPIALIAFVLQIAAGALLMLTASTHVRHKPAERALSIRVLFAAIAIALTWLIVGNMSCFGTVTPDDFKSWLTAFSTIILSVAFLSASAFATGIIKKSEDDSVMTYALSPGKAFTSNIGGSISYMFLWTTLTYATMGLTFLWLSKTTGSKFPHGFWASYFQIAAAILVMVSAVSSIGILASSFTKLRKNAAALVILFVILIFAGYGIMLINYDLGNYNHSSPTWQLAAFWPMTPILASTNEWSNDLPKLPWIKHAWLMTCMAYLAITFVSLALAGAANAKGMGVREEEF